jgi:hypothetical protein
MRGVYEQRHPVVVTTQVGISFDLNQFVCFETTRLLYIRICVAFSVAYSRIAVRSDGYSFAN